MQKLTFLVNNLLFRLKNINTFLKSDIRSFYSVSIPREGSLKYVQYKNLFPLLSKRANQSQTTFLFFLHSQHGVVES